MHSADASEPLARAGAPGRAKWLALAFLALIALFQGSLLVGVYGGAEPPYDARDTLIGGDFLAFWAASDLVLAGRTGDLTDPATFESHYETEVGPVYRGPGSSTEPALPWYYPPHSLVIVAPLALVPYLWSYALWMAVTISAYLAAAARRGLARTELPILLLAPAAYVTFLLGQNGFLSAALLIGGLRLVERRPWLAGVLLGLLSYKPHLGLLVPVALIAGRHWRPFLSAAATVVGLLAISLAWFGLESWTAFFEVGPALQAELLNQRDPSFMQHAIAPIMSARLAGIGELGRYALYLALAAFAAWGVFTTYRNAQADEALKIAVLLAGATLASPYGQSYDLPMVGVAVLWCFQHGLRKGLPGWELVLLGLVWLLPFLAIVLNPRGYPPGPVVLTAFFILLLAKANGWPARPGTQRSPSLPNSPG